MSLVGVICVHMPAYMIVNKEGGVQMTICIICTAATIEVTAELLSLILSLRASSLVSYLEDSSLLT